MAEKTARHPEEAQTAHPRPLPVFSSESPIHTSTPPVTIIGSTPRVSGGFRLSDR
jgi:hypothetical protein